MSPSASSISRAVSTLKPCWEKYSLMEKQIDSSSSTMSNLAEPCLVRSVTAPACVRPRRSSRRRPDTRLSVNIEVVGFESLVTIGTRKRSRSIWFHIRLGRLCAPESENLVLNNHQQNFAYLARPSADDSPMLVFESVELA